MTVRGGPADAGHRRDWRLLVTDPAAGSWNMAVDDWLIESVREGGAPALRFYRWSPACLSFGRNQPAREVYPPELLEELEIAAVRRVTGGRAVLHDCELTYSVVAPAGALGSARDAYVRINRILLDGLRALGVPATLQLARAAPAPIPSSTPCFVESLPGELSLGAGKLVGSAQAHIRGVLLQHGSILIERGDAARRLAERGLDVERGAAFLADALPAAPSADALIAALAAAWEHTLGRLVVQPDDAVDSARVASLEARFLDPAWTWRR